MANYADDKFEQKVEHQITLCLIRVSNIHALPKYACYGVIQGTSFPCNHLSFQFLGKKGPLHAFKNTAYP